MASLGSFIRSAAQATYSAYRRVPTRWRLAGGSAALTFVILCGFAIIVGFLTTRQIRIQFNDSVRKSADYLQRNARIGLDPTTGRKSCGALPDLASADGARVQAYYATSLNSYQLMCAFGGGNARAPIFRVDTEQQEQFGYRVEVRQVSVDELPGRLAQYPGLLVYARPVSATKATVAKVRFFLVLGVVGGSALALAAGLLVARRAMAPIA
jgi:two-component system, OmpR family, sensor kinase